MIMNQINRLCVDRGLSLRQLGQVVGISTGTFTGWSRGAKPSNATLKKIADYFGVTVEWLLSDAPLPGSFEGKQHSEEYLPLSAHEKMFVDLWRTLDEAGQNEIVKAFMKQYNIEVCRMRGIPNPYEE